jgi:hypothetical protein
VSSNEQRRAATEQYARGIDAINAVFDRLDDLSTARARVAAVAAGWGDGDDPVRGAEAILEAAGVVGEALAALRTARAVAVEYRSKAELAGDVGTRPTLLFPRQGAPDVAHGVNSHAGAESVTS